MEGKKIVLELIVSELLFIREKVCIPYRWGGYEWENEIEKTVREKLESAYQKPVMSAAEYRERLDKESEVWKSEGLGNFMAFMAAAARRELHFEYEIKGEEEHDDFECGDSDT